MKAGTHEDCLWKNKKELSKEWILAEHFGELQRRDFRDLKNLSSAPVWKERLSLRNEASLEASRKNRVIRS